MRNKNWLQLPSGRTQVVWGPPSCSMGGSQPQVPVLSMGCSNLCPGTRSSSAFPLHQPRCLQGCCAYFSSCSSLSKLPHSFLHLLSYVITEAPPALLLGSALASSGSVWGLAGSESNPALPRARLPSQVPGAKQEPPQPRG